MDPAAAAQSETSIDHAIVATQVPRLPVALAAKPKAALLRFAADATAYGPESTSHAPDAAPQVPHARHLHPIRRFGKIVAGSPVMHEVFDALARFAPLEVTVMLLGETGTGKDVLAHAIHERSTRAGGPFVVFDCGAVAANLAESELLGHERGAFTGAVSTHPGAFERAHGGTLFLDEIGELPIDVQPRLLRALESRTVRRVGGTQERAVDVRILAATNRGLRSDLTAGKFREDLYFRLAAAIVPVPSLRDRLDDLPLIVRGLLHDLGQPDLHVTDDALSALRAHPWPGNVRELKNALACALAFVDEGSSLDTRHLRLLACSSREESALDGHALAGLSLAAIERAAIRQTMIQMDGNKARAARALEIAVSTLYEKIKKYGL